MRIEYNDPKGRLVPTGVTIAADRPANWSLSHVDDHQRCTEDRLDEALA